MMKAVVLSKPNQIEIQNVPLPKVRQEDECLANVEFVGMCQTDHQLTQKGLPENRILGHEVVCRLPNEESFFVLNDEIPCGKCSYCVEGLTSHCYHLRELGVNDNGGYAEKLLAPRSYLHPFDFKNPALGVLVEPLSCTLRGVKRILTALALLPVSSPQTLILGGGVSGALVTYLLNRDSGFSGDINLYDITTEKLSWSEYLSINRIKEPEPDLAHVIIECSGSSKGLETAFKMVRKGGLVCIYGVPRSETVFPISPLELFAKEITVIASMAGVTNEIIPEAIAIIEQDEDFFNHLLGRQVVLEQVPEELLTWKPQPGTRTFVNVGGNNGNLS
jgi:L-iditol 2-dehydrogenase